MRRMSLKLKLTLLYTGFMMIVIGLVLSVLLSLSSREVLVATQVKLKDRVQESVDEIEWEGGEAQPESEFYLMEKNVYLSLYDEHGYFLYGKIPASFVADVTFHGGQVQTIRNGKDKWYVYDLPLRYAGTVVYIRGITSATDAEESFAVTVRLAFIILPMMALLLGAIVYLLTRRMLIPVQTITETVQEIRGDTDLSRRVGATNNHGDEIALLAATFDEMLDALEKTFAREKQFTSDVSHELRTPVSVILAQCDACLADETCPEKQREELLLIQKKAKQVAGMIAQLLLLSRADQGRQKLYKEEVNVSELLELVVEEQQMLANERAIRIHSEIQEDLVANLDETFFIRMLDNLFSNAIAYGKEGGTIEVTLKREGAVLRGSVKDDGIGIAPEKLPHIWERFYRADPSRTEGTHSGLGLSIVKWIVEAHGGTIEVMSTVGAGTEFMYQIPISEKL